MLTYDGANYIANLLVANESLPTSWFIALLNSIPYQSIDGTDLVDYEIDDGTAYERKELLVGDFTTAANGVVRYDLDLSWDLATVDWSTIFGYAFVSEAVDGTVLAVGLFPSPIRVDTDQYVYIPAGTVSISFSSIQAGDYE